MERSHHTICEMKASHFLTCTVLNWIPIVTRPQTVVIILDALQYRQQHKSWKVYGYAVLENDLHLIVYADDLLAELPLFKSYTAAGQVIDYLKEYRAERVLKQLTYKYDQDYQCWEEGSHPQHPFLPRVKPHLNTARSNKELP